MRRFWLLGILCFLGLIFWQVYAKDPYFYCSAHDLFVRARAAQERGEAAEAVRFARLARERDPQNGEYGEFLAWRLLEANRLEEALNLFRQVWQQQAIASALTGQVMALARLQRREEALALLAAYLEKHPREPSILRLAAGLASQDPGTQGQALAWYQRLYDLNPQDRETRRHLVELLTAQHRYAEAIPLQEQEVAEEPDNIQALHRLALLHAWHRDHQAAVPIYGRLLELAVQDQALRLEAAKNAEAAHNVEQAIVHYLELYARAPEKKEYALILARLWSQTGQHGKAAAILGPVLDSDASLAERRFYALELLLAGQPGQALKIYRQVWEAGDSHQETILNLARLYAQRQQFRQAAAFWDEAARRQLLNQDLRREAALTYAAAHRYQEAVAVLQGVDRRDPKLLLFVGQMYFYQKHWQQAVKYYREYLQQVPTDQAARRQLAQTLSFFPEGLEAAATEYETAALASGDPALLLQRAAVLLQRAQNASDDPSQRQTAPQHWAAAAAALRQVPSTGLSPELLREKGTLLLWLGDQEEALACFDDYLRTRPQERRILLEKARILIMLGRGQEAAEVLRRLPPDQTRAAPAPALWPEKAGHGLPNPEPSEVAGQGRRRPDGAGELEILTLFLEAALTARQWPEAQRRAWQLYLTQLPSGTPLPLSWTAARRRLQEAGARIDLPPATRVAMARALCQHPDLTKEPGISHVAVDLCLANITARQVREPLAYQASLLVLKYLLPRLGHYEDLQDLIYRLPGLRAKSPEYYATLSFFTNDLGRQGGKLQYLLHALDDRQEQYPARRPGDLLSLAALATELGDWRAAREYFEQLHRLRPDDQKVADLRLQVLAAAKETGRLLKALEEQPQTPETALEMAKVYLERQQYDGALAALAAIPRSHRLWPEAQRLVGQAHLARQDYPAALAALRTLRHQGHSDIALTMAEAQVLEAMTDRAGATAAYTTVIQQAPDGFTAQVARARLARLRGDWAGAWRHFAVALQERPQEITILNELEQVREQLRPTLASRNLPEFWRGERRPEEGWRPWQFGRYDRDPGVLAGYGGRPRSLLPFPWPYALTPETTLLEDRNRLKAVEIKLAGGLWLSRVLPVHLALGYRAWQQSTTGSGPAHLDLGLKPVFQQTSQVRTTWERAEATLAVGPLVLGERLKVTGELSGRCYWRQVRQQVWQYGQKSIPPIILNTSLHTSLSESESRQRLLGSLELSMMVQAQTDFTLRYARRDIFEPDAAVYPRLYQQVTRLDRLPLLTLHQIELAVSHQFQPGLTYQGNLGQAWFADHNQRFSLYQGLRWQAINQPRMHLDLTPSYYLALYRLRQEAYFSPHAYHALGLSLDFDRQLPQVPVLSRYLFLLPTLVLQVAGQVIDNDGRWGPGLSTLAGLEAEPMQNLYVGLHYFYFKEWATHYWLQSLIFGLKWRF